MARRSPARVRADAHHRPPAGGFVRTIPDLSPRGRTALARLERDRFWPGAAAWALATWTAFVHDPTHRLWQPGHGCDEFRCCPDYPEVRAILHAVAHALPTQDARNLRRHLATLDALW